MRQVISAPPTIDVVAKAEALAKQAGAKLLRDPSRAACERYGYQTLYEMPLVLQKETRLRLITDHIANLKANPNIVCDHSVFAWLADWMRWCWAKTPTEEWEAVMSVAVEATGLYDRIEHVAVGPAQSYNGYDWLDQRNGTQIERLMRHLYVDLNCLQKVVGLPDVKK
jgi:hypothetical protein